MTRRLTLVIVGVVLATVFITGVITVALARANSRQATENRLREQVNLVGVADLNRLGPRLQTDLQQRVQPAQVNVFLLGQNGARRRLGPPLPTDVDLTRVDPDELTVGDPMSGTSGSTAFAFVLVETENQRGIIMLTSDTAIRFGPVGQYLIVAAIVAVLLGVVIAAWLGRRLSKPVLEAEAATHRIAAGDLETRVAVAPSRRDELASLGHSINQMAESLERSRGLEQQFLLSVSHDLRTPLTSIRGYADALADGTLTDAVQGGEVIQAEARRLERLVRDLLDLARLEAREFSFESAPVDLSGVAEDAVSVFGPDARSAGVEIVARTDGAITVLGDRDRLGQVTANLVENALKYAHERVEVTTLNGGMAGRLVVADDGAGIAAEDLPHVFERLYVAQNRPVRKESGSGLGLAIVRELVTAMGGTVHAEASPTGGTAMIVELPT